MSLRNRTAAALPILVLLQMAEGFDVFLVGKIAPLIAQSFALPAQSLAWAFSLHQVGLAIGAVVGGALADKVGPARVVASCAILGGAATLAVPACPGVDELALVRLVAGVFLGGIGAVSITTASRMGRAMPVAVVLAAYSAGSSTGSLFALALVDDWGWQAGFQAIGSLLILLGLAAAIILPQTAWGERRDRVAGALRVGEYRVVATLCGAFALSMGLVSLLAAWLPTFYHDLAGVPVQRFASTGILYAPAAIGGMLLVGFLAGRTSERRLAAVAFPVQSLTLAILGMLSFGSAAFPATYVAMVVAQAAGQAILNQAVARSVHERARGAAYGLVAAAGRLGGVISPLVGAAALEARVSITVTLAVAAMVPMMAFVALLRALNRRSAARL